MHALLTLFVKHRLVTKFRRKFLKTMPMVNVSCHKQPGINVRQNWLKMSFPRGVTTLLPRVGFTMLMSICHLHADNIAEWPTHLCDNALNTSRNCKLTLIKSLSPPRICPWPDCRPTERHFYHRVPQILLLFLLTSNKRWNSALLFLVDRENAACTKRPSTEILRSCFGMPISCHSAASHSKWRNISLREAFKTNPVISFLFNYYRIVGVRWIL